MNYEKRDQIKERNCASHRGERKETKKIQDKPKISYKNQLLGVQYFFDGRKREIIKKILKAMKDKKTAYTEIKKRLA